MNDPRANNLLRWSVENSDVSKNGNAPAQPRTQLDEEALKAFFLGGAVESEAEQMKNAMKVIHEDSTIEDKRVAFGNLEYLLESIDNANNLEPLQLWTPLVDLLNHKEAEIRMHAAWCCGTAIQNNPRGQERILVIGAIPTLVRLATKDANPEVRKKAIRALSSTIRNFPPGLDVVLSHMPTAQKPQDKVNAGDMDSLDTWMNKLRQTV